jgi:hypothetical protein
MKIELTELQKTQIAYAHFTLEEWQFLVSCVSHRLSSTIGTHEETDTDTVNAMLVKFPSAVL